MWYLNLEDGLDPSIENSKLDTVCIDDLRSIPNQEIERIRLHTVKSGLENFIRTIDSYEDVCFYKRTIEELDVRHPCGNCKALNGPESLFNALATQGNNNVLRIENVIGALIRDALRSCQVDNRFLLDLTFRLNSTWRKLGSYSLAKALLSNIINSPYFSSTSIGRKALVALAMNEAARFNISGVWNIFEQYPLDIWYETFAFLSYDENTSAQL